MAFESSDLEAVLNDDAQAGAFLQLVVHPADFVEIFRSIDPARWPHLLDLIEDDEIRAEVVAELDEHERDDLLDHLAPNALAPLLEEMESDDAADVVGELEPHEQRSVLAKLDDELRKEVETLLAFPDDSAGGIMQLERAEVQRDQTIADARAIVRALHRENSDIHRVYVVDSDGRLEGTVDLVKLVVTDDDVPIAEVVEPTEAQVTPLVDQEEVAELFRKYDLVSLPVVDERGLLLGVIQIDDIVDVLQEEADEDALLSAGTDAEELLYRDRAIAIAKVRLPWIGINLLGLICGAMLLRQYGLALSEVWVQVSLFLPAVMAMGGNVGTQSATIIIRGLAAGRIAEGDLGKTVFREMRVGLLMGIICGSIAGVAGLAISGGAGALGLVVGLGMMSAMTTAAVFGSLAPGVMKKFGIDPAIASGPLVTTANDLIGIVVYLSTALVFLDALKVTT